MRAGDSAEASAPGLSIVIPVFNGSATIGSLVERIHRVFHGTRIEVVLVNDGSRDDSEQVCARLADSHPDSVAFIHLSRNFGEHNAVLAGLNYASGDYVAILDDDGQNPPEELPRLLREIKLKNLDVVYGRYRVKQHGWLRNLGSGFNDRIANVLLGKPRGLYLCSFKILNRFVVQQVIKYRGAFAYLDGLILRTTQNIGQIDVRHEPRQHGRSNYTLVKLVGLWLNMFLNFSILPLRLATWTGLITSLISVLLFVMVFVDKFYIDPSAKPGIPTVLCTLVFFGGLNLLIAGMLGEYLGRLYLDQTGTPQFVVRYVRPRTGAGPRSEPGAVLQTASEMDGLHHPRQPGPRAEPAPHELVPVP